VLPGKGIDQAIQIAGSLHDYLQANPLKYKTNLVPITISYGGASMSQDNPSTYKQLLKLADERLYSFKNNRRRSVPTKVFKFLNKIR
jgi:diguanylate cyclase (GGDEF)-like protein